MFHRLWLIVSSISATALATVGSQPQEPLCARYVRTFIHPMPFPLSGSEEWNLNIRGFKLRGNCPACALVIVPEVLPARRYFIETGSSDRNRCLPAWIASSRASGSI
ncbi:hypothetical protein BO71DRAFT_400428 [Aspergillus ellipticus CBS 707.79]|uniref:Secreted protein n=1 Tax=Aspergillus ellipticus CBS 707.79 TaxID=1448320 RepID=A0A319DE87_9EURO|nr:hypothetical protein BO71DRAFT_400428 [Aspergillus ellipticus CBS 707.79]